MDLPTYTNIWRIEKRLYKLYDFRLPMPLPVGTFGVALGVFALWVVLLSILNAPFDFGNGWHLVLWVVPPGVITVLATRPVVEGKRLTELLISQARFLVEARVYTRLAPEYEPAEARVSARVWHRDPDAGPLPLTRSAARRVQAEEAAERELAAVSEDADQELAAEEHPAAGSSGLRADPEAAPPLRGVPVGAASRPAPGPAPVAEPVSRPAPGPDDSVEYTPVREHTSARRVPSVAAAASGGHGPVGSGTAPIGGEGAVAEQQDGSRHLALAADTPGYEDRARSGVGRRVLNYFGFGLGAEPGADGSVPDGGGHHGGRTGDGGPDGGRGRRGPERDLPEGADDTGEGFDEPLYVTEEDEQRDRDEWFAQLRASSGHTPLGLTSKGAYASSETGAMSSADLADAVTPDAPGPARDAEERRRAEQIAEARAPEGTGEESAAARRLRGRVQGIRVAKDLADRRESPVDEEGPALEAGPEPAPVRERVRPARPEPGTRARGQALPDSGGAGPDRSAKARRQGRPHAAPWALGADEEGNRPGSGGGTDYPDLSDYAARYAAATGRPTAAGEVSAAPWLPPASGTPEEAVPGGEQDQEQSGPGPREEGGDAGIGRSEAGPQASHAATGLGAARRTGSEPEAATEPADGAGTEPSAGAAPASVPADGAAKPPLQLDHGTGEHEAVPVEPAPEDPAERGPEWSEHMSVLDQHLIKADTPAPPRPKFADAVPSGERADEHRDPSEWFDDGKRRHPDQPKVGDRDNPVIAVSELREERRAAAEARERQAREQQARERAARERQDRERVVREEAEAERRTAGAAAEPDEGPKPPTQLDHGTGELVSFAEVRKDPAPAESGPASGHGAGTASPEPAASAPDSASESGSVSGAAARRTEAELAEAEADALRARRAPAVAETEPEAPARSDRLSRTMRAASTTPAASADSSAAPAGSPAAGEGGSQARAEQTAAEPTAPEAEESTTDAPQGAPGEHDLHDGVFHRVAQNARRIGQLFGQPVPGEEPEPTRGSGPASADTDPAKPELELDHGTGEQARLGDTPNGVPSQRPEPESARQAEEPAADSGGTRGWRRLAKVVTGGGAPVRSDLPASDIERLRIPLAEPRSLVVLGCTGGAGQTVTALMVGHTLAAHRDDRVVAVDVNPGPNGLSRRVGAQAPETLTALLANADAVDEYDRMRSYAGRAGTGLEVVQTLDDPYVQTLDDRDYGQLTGLLGGFYGVTLLDPAATGVARALPVADGLVLVAPASADAERAVSMTFEWLDGNGYGALRANSVLVVNGVSKRSLQDVDAAERVARGRCRAIVRIPWDDHLGSSYTKIDVGALRPATKRAHGALGGVLVNALAPASTAT
ncbi:hypothetical protein GCM10007079_42260 [Nocardiopsis terrae]|uniref:MinD-like ATPase involved in chromosome partitioning or flagellar assembly n=1 Tax=Nocardiopsis terrae TaxID=372655 RepID=A0ABR9HLP4_9ACTN|nr:conjugal transfer protein [Nocardiopsis terrae]MBE1459957.1 MinD-like ATPase involved in chromosome partitioning or flagellar assembly [Nocardiopsis terrae]GHC93150.1 hypothetical protein GCM10007079_42260 [Nocardiopsis terrae]